MKNDQKWVGKNKLVRKAYIDGWNLDIFALSAPGLGPHGMS